jgi:transcriptional regulator with XRE-family HTH domain
MSAYDLVVEARQKQNLPSDNALAVLMGIDNQKISNWKNGKGKPNGETALYLAELADLKPSEARELLYKNKSSGFANLSLLIVTSIFMSLILLTNFTTATTLYTLCEVRAMMLEAYRKLTRLTGFAGFQLAF